MRIGIKDPTHLGDSMCLSSVFRLLRSMYPEHTFGLYQRKPYHEDIYPGNIIPVMTSCDAYICPSYTGHTYTLCELLADNVACQVNALLKGNKEYDVLGLVPELEISEDDLKQYSYLGDYVLIVPASPDRGPHKNYPYLQEIIDSRPDINFAVVGHSYDKIKKLKNVYDMVGNTSVKQSLILVARAKHIISYSGALVHASAAFGTPCTVILGCSDRWNYTNYPNVTQILSSCSCGYTWMNPCSRRLCPDSHIIDDIPYPDCISRINPHIIAQYI